MINSPILKSVWLATAIAVVDTAGDVVKWLGHLGAPPEDPLITVLGEDLRHYSYLAECTLTRAETAEAERDRYRKALQAIARIQPDGGSDCEELMGRIPEPPAPRTVCRRCRGAGVEPETRPEGAYWRGHHIEESGGVWRYSDTGRLVSENKDRPCGHCGLPNTPEGHDGCLGTIPGARNACCGHGDVSAFYIQEETPALDEGAAEDLRHYSYLAYHTLTRAETAEAERDRYRAALQKIARIQPDGGSNCEELTAEGCRCPQIWCEDREGWCDPCLAAAALEGE